MTRISSAIARTGFSGPSPRISMVTSTAPGAEPSGENIHGCYGQSNGRRHEAPCRSHPSCRIADGQDANRKEDMGKGSFCTTLHAARLITGWLVATANRH
jgi:hypothetical protein